MPTLCFANIYSLSPPLLSYPATGLSRLPMPRMCSSGRFSIPGIPGIPGVVRLPSDSARVGVSPAQLDVIGELGGGGEDGSSRARGDGVERMVDGNEATLPPPPAATGGEQTSGPPFVPS